MQGLRWDTAIWKRWPIFQPSGGPMGLWSAASRLRSSGPAPAGSDPWQLLAKISPAVTFSYMHRRLNPSFPALPTVGQALQKGRIPPLCKEGVREIFGRIFLLNYGLHSNFPLILIAATKPGPNTLSGHSVQYRHTKCLVIASPRGVAISSFMGLRSLFRTKRGISEFASASLRNRVAPRNDNFLLGRILASKIVTSVEISFDSVLSI